MAAKKAKGKGGARKSGLDGTDAMARLAALRNQLSGLLDRLIAAEKALADALRTRDGAAPRTRRRPAQATATRRRTATSARRTPARTRRAAPRSGG